MATRTPYTGPGSNTGLRWRDVERIRNRFFSGKSSQRQLATEYMVARSTIQRIVYSATSTTR